MSERFQAISSRSVELALALNPIDVLTGVPLREDATVTVDGVYTDPRLNPSGYWTYLDPPVTFDTAVVSVTVEPSPEYAVRTLDVDTSEDPPAKRIEMYPSTAYPFADRTTLIQGRIVYDGSNPVFSAKVGIEDTDLETRTNLDGSFVLEVSGITTTESAGPDELLRVDPDSSDPRRVQVYSQQGPPKTPMLVADHHSHPEETRPLEITEGERHVLDTPIEL